MIEEIRHNAFKKAPIIKHRAKHDQKYDPIEITRSWGHRPYAQTEASSRQRLSLLWRGRIVKSGKHNLCTKTSWYPFHPAIVHGSRPNWTSLESKQL